MMVRQWEILRLLGQRPSTLAEITASVGDPRVCDRVIRRDLEALQAAGFPLYTDKHDDGAVRWHLLTNDVAPRRAA